MIFSKNLILGSGWLPWNWGRSIANTVQASIESIGNMINGALVGAVEAALELVNYMFDTSVDALRSEVVMTPEQFDMNLVNQLKTISETALLPVAIILITYMFAYEIYELMTAQNKGSEFGIGEITMLIIKTSAMIFLATNAFTISLAFSDLSTWIVRQVPEESTTVSEDLVTLITDDMRAVIIDRNTGNPMPEKTEIADNEREQYYWDFKLGIGLMTLLVSLVAVIATAVMAGIMYLVAWSRMIMILLYITVSPIPMATLMNSSWFGSIGQNYIKNLLALMLQGFMMLVLLVIYAGMMNRIPGLITDATTGNPFYGLLLLVVSMAIIVNMLMKTHELSKSIMGAS